MESKPTTWARLLSTCLLLAPLAAQTRQEVRTPAPVVNETLAVQVMLDRLGFSSGEIDGRVGPNVRRALQAFQGANGLPATRDVDEETWKQILTASTTQQPLTLYEITAADVAGPFVERIPADLIEQSKLRELGYTSALEALAEKFHCSPDVLRRLNPGATFSRAGERIMVPHVEATDASPPRRRHREAPLDGSQASPTGPRSSSDRQRAVSLSRIGTACCFMHRSRRAVSMTRSPWVPGGSRRFSGCPRSTTTPISFGTQIRSTPRHALRPGRTIP